MKKLEEIDHNLPHAETHQTGVSKLKIWKKRGYQGCIHGYSTHPECCDLEHYVALIVLDTLKALIEAIYGPNYEDTRDYKQDQIKI